MKRLLAELGSRLAAEGRHGEILMAGGSRSIVGHGLPRRSEDIDAIYLREGAAIRRLAQGMATDLELPADWLNDRVKTYLSPSAPQAELLALPGLIVFAVTLDYLFYMKCTGEDFDAGDLLFIGELLGGVTYLEAAAMYARYAIGSIPSTIDRWLDDLFPS